MDITITKVVDMESLGQRLYTSIEQRLVVALIQMDMVALVIRVLIVMDLRLNTSVVKQVALVMRVLIVMDLRLNTSTEVVDMESLGRRLSTSVANEMKPLRVQMKKIKKRWLKPNKKSGKNVEQLP